MIDRSGDDLVEYDIDPRSAVWSPSGSHIAFVNAGGSFAVLNIESGIALTVFPRPPAPYTSMAVHDWSRVETRRFADVAMAHPFFAGIEWTAARGITMGCDPPSNDRYCPDEPISRGETAAMLARMLELTEVGSVDFVGDDGSVFEVDMPGSPHSASRSRATHRPTPGSARMHRSLGAKTPPCCPERSRSQDKARIRLWMSVDRCLNTTSPTSPRRE